MNPAASALSVAPSCFQEVVVSQFQWAADRLRHLLANAPDEPDAAWLRLFTLADRIFHRNWRALQKQHQEPSLPPATGASATSPIPPTPPPTDGFPFPPPPILQAKPAAAPKGRALLERVLDEKALGDRSLPRADPILEISCSPTRPSR